MKKNKALQNTTLVILMSIGVAVLFTEYIHIGVFVLTLAGMLSSILIFRERRGRRSFLSYVSAATYLYVVISFCISSFDGFGRSLNNFVNWVLYAVVIGTLSVILTGLQLFKVNRQSNALPIASIKTRIKRL